MKEAYGVEIVAFVASVGKVALPFADEDDQVLGKEYVDLVKTVTREQVDKEITRCPHPETSKKIEEVRNSVQEPSRFIAKYIIEHADIVQ